MKGTLEAEGTSRGRHLPAFRRSGPGELLGTGHPDQQGKLPNFLG